MAKSKAKSKSRPKTKVVYKTKFRTRVVTKIKRVGSTLKSKSKSKQKSRKSTKADHVVLLSAGAGAGALTTTICQIAQRNGVPLPWYVSKIASAVTGFLVGKHVSRSNTKAIESSIASVATSFAEDKVISGQPLLNTNLGSNGLSGGNVY